MLGLTGNPEVWALASDRGFTQNLSWDPMVLEPEEESCSPSKGEQRILWLSVNMWL